jgi:hypothetical protein
MTDSLDDLRTLVLLWAGVAALVLIRHARYRQSVGLVLSYVFSLGAIHWLASALYLLPWHDTAARDLTVVGLRESLFALVGFWLGAELARFSMPAAGEDETDDPSRALQPRLINLYIVSGLIMYGLLFTVAASLPSATAVLSGGSTLMAVGIGLKLWNALQTNSLAAGRLWLAVAFVFPLGSVLAQGFLGYGFAALMVVLAFRASFHRLTIKSVAYGAVVAFLGLSIYTTYMRDRTLIREVVWTGGRVAERARQVQETLTSAEWFDFTNTEHLGRVDQRLNQNFLVGSAVVYMQDRMVPYASGSTIRDALLSLVPRVLWPDKPISAGSGDLVSTYTGIEFAFGTSVGIGHVLEWYVNFGRAGAVAGLFLIGWFIATADREAAHYLNRRDSHRFLLWYLPSLNLLQVGGSLAEATAGAAAAYLLVHALNWLVERLWPSAMHVEQPIRVPQVELHRS